MPKVYQEKCREDHRDSGAEVEKKTLRAGKQRDARGRVKAVDQGVSVNRLGHRVGSGFGAGWFSMNCFIDFLAVHRNLFRRDNAEADFVATNLNDGDGDVIVDDNTLVLFPGKY